MLLIRSAAALLSSYCGPGRVFSYLVARCDVECQPFVWHTPQHRQLTIAVVVSSVALLSRFASPPLHCHLPPGVRHVDLVLHLMAQPPWDARMELSANKPFYILHYTYGNDYTLDGKFTPGGTAASPTGLTQCSARILGISTNCVTCVSCSLQGSLVHCYAGVVKSETESGL